MSKTFASNPSSVRGQRGRGRGRGGTQTNALNEPSLVASGITPGPASRGAARGRGGGASTTRGRGGGGGASRGRGGGLGTGQKRNAGPSGDKGGKGKDDGDPLEPKIVYNNGFTIIKPDDKKRKNMLEQAEREAKQYEKFKLKNKPTSFSYVGTAGRGEGAASLEEARRQQMRTQADHSKASRLVREHDRRNEERENEKRALENRKEAARKQGMVLKQKHNDEEMHRVNQAFLDRLVAQTKSHAGPSSEQS